MGEVPNRQDTIEIEEPSVLLTINQTYREGMTEKEVLEVTSRAWKLNSSDLEKIDMAKYAFGIYFGKVMGVFSILSWSKDLYSPGRWAFNGELAPESMRGKYLGKLPQNNKGDPRTVIFINC